MFFFFFFFNDTATTEIYTLSLHDALPISACAKPVGNRTEGEMSVTDPVADMLTRVRNACQAGHRRVDMPVSKLKVEIARLLRDNHYIQDFKVLDDGRHGLLRLYLKYHNDAPERRVGKECRSRWSPYH